MAESYAITAVLEAKVDGLVNGFKKATSAVDGFVKKNEKTFDSFKQVGKAATVAGAAVAGGLLFAVKKAATFEAGMSKVAAISGATGKDFDLLSDKAREMGSKTSFSATQAAEGLEYMALAGWSTEQMLGGITPILHLAEAGALDLGRASDLVTDSMAGLGLQVKDLDGYLDKVAKTAASSNTDIDTLMEAFVIAGGTFERFNVPLEESSAFLGVLANRGFKGAEAGTALNAIMSRLTQSTGPAAKQLKKMGISAFDSKGQFKGMEFVMQEVTNSMNDMTDAEKANAIEKLAGLDHGKSFSAMVAGLGNEYQDLKGKIIDSDGALKKMRDTMKDNLQGELENLSSAFEEIAISIGTALLPFVKQLTKFAQLLADKFNNLGDRSKSTIAVMSALAAVFLLIVGPLMMFIGFIPAIVAGLGHLKVVALAVGGGLKKFGLYLMRLINPSALLGNSVKVLGRALGVLTGPIGWVVLAIITLITTFISLFKTNKEFKTRVVGMWDAVVSKTKDAVKAIARVMGPAYSKVWDAANRVFTAYVNLILGLFASLKKKGASLWDSFGSAVVKSMDVFLAGWSRVWPTVEKVFLTAWKGVQVALGIGSKLMIGMLDSIALALEGDFSGAWKLATKTVKVATEEIGKVLKELGKVVATYVVDKFNEAKKAIQDKMLEWVAAVAVKMDDIKSKITTKLAEWTSSIVTWFTGMPGTISEKMGEWSIAILEWFDTMPEKILTKLADWSTAIKEWTAEQNEENIRQFALWGAEIALWFDSIPSKISDSLIGWWLAIGTWFSETKESIKEWMLGWLVTITTWFADTKSKMLEKLAAWTVSLSGWFTDIPSKIAVWLAMWWVKISTWFSEIPAKITIALGAWWGAIKDWFAGVPDKPEIKDAGKKMIDKFSEGNEEKKQEFMDKLGALILDVLTAVMAAVVVAFIAAGRELISRIMTGIEQSREGLKAKALSLLAQMAISMSKFNLVQVGKDLIMGLIRGISSKIKDVATAARGVAMAAKNAVTGFFKVKSPSRVMMDIGVYLVQGLANGMTGSANLAMRAAEMLGLGVTDSFNPNLAMSTGDIAGQVNSINRQANRQMQSHLTSEFNVSKQPAVINVHVGSNRIASEIVDDISNLQNRSENRRRKASSRG